jgi:hypothetical protein
VGEMKCACTSAPRKESRSSILELELFKPKKLRSAVKAQNKRGTGFWWGMSYDAIMQRTRSPAQETTE